eukprot:6820334-Alexandrium_andersonii.AAC.1
MPPMLPVSGKRFQQHMRTVRSRNGPQAIRVLLCLGDENEGYISQLRHPAKHKNTASRAPRSRRANPSEAR